MVRKGSNGITDYIFKPIFQLLSVNEFIAEGLVDIYEYTAELVVMNVSGISEVLQVTLKGKELHITYFSRSCARVCGVIDGVEVRRVATRC